jgi:uncharacterized repeat protein (TIGR03943 family)
MAAERVSRPPLTARGIVRVAVLAAWTFGFAWLLGSGRYQSFIHKDLWPLLAGGLTLLLLMILAVSATPTPEKADPRRLWRMIACGAVLLLPLAYAFTVPAGGLGSHAFAQRTVEVASPFELPAALSSVAAPPPADERGPIGLLALLMNSDRYADKPIVVDGMVHTDRGAGEEGFILFRFAIVCCAADAIPVSARVRWPAAASLPPDAWVRVQGVLRLREEDGTKRAVIEASQVDRVQPPSNPYLFPR